MTYLVRYCQAAGAGTFCSTTPNEPDLNPPTFLVLYYLSLSATMATLTETASPGSIRRLTNRNTNRYSVTALFSMAAEQDADVDDELARGVHLRLYFYSSPLK